MNRFIILICLISLASCDPVFHADIVNETQAPLKLEIKFDKDTLAKNWNGRPYIPYLESYPNFADISAISFDSVNLIKTFEIKPNSSFPLESGIGQYPDYSQYSRIKIIGKDTLVLESQKEIEKSFTKKGQRTWELKIE